MNKNNTSQLSRSRYTAIDDKDPLLGCLIVILILAFIGLMGLAAAAYFLFVKSPCL